MDLTCTLIFILIIMWQCSINGILFYFIYLLWELIGAHLVVADARLALELAEALNPRF
jgi:multisubunit Na+/H+ antiporter MnhE subunit